jgi:hypothetical protein
MYPEAVGTYRRYIDQLVKLLRGLLAAGGAVNADHTVDGIADPFLQVRSALVMVDIISRTPV